MEREKTYRRDIDGLRALAIIPVLLFHAGIAGFSGGFVGVDIFFVISGFLITSIILREISSGTFSLAHFWERRIRRIVPALFFIAVAVYVGSYFIVLYPVDFIDFGHSLIAQSLFLANIFFMRKSDYFAGPSESMPLLHTWSLSVEEQFYICLPLILFVLWYVTKNAFSRIVVWFIGALVILSFVYNIYLGVFTPGDAFSIPFISYIWGSATNASADFFFLPARAWELLIGSLLATGIFSIHRKWISEAVTIFGLLCIVFAVTSFDGDSHFPGYFALFPTIGAACIILGNTHTTTKIGQLLSFPVLVWIGLISYSLYLWHWPLIVFTKMLFENAEAYLPFTLLLTFLLSWMTYVFVETPFRKKKICPSQSRMFIFGFCALLILITLGFVTHYFKGFPDRASEAARAIAAASVNGNPREFECFRKNYREVFTVGEPCILGDQSDRNHIDFVLWGDSHADAAMPIVDTMAKEKGETGVFFGAGGCRPMMWESVLSKDERCEQIKAEAVSFIREHDVKKVLLISSWESDPSKVAFKTGLRVGEGVPVNETTESFYDALHHTVSLVSNASSTVYVMKKVPVYEEYDIRRAFNKAAYTNQPLPAVTQSSDEYLTANAEENEAIDVLAQKGMVEVLDPKDVFCTQTTCSLTIGENILYKNGTHINTSGAILLRPMFEKFFDR